MHFYLLHRSHCSILILKCDNWYYSRFNKILSFLSGSLLLFTLPGSFHHSSIFGVKACNWLQGISVIRRNSWLVSDRKKGVEGCETISLQVKWPRKYNTIWNQGWQVKNAFIYSSVVADIMFWIETNPFVVSYLQAAHLRPL